MLTQEKLNLIEICSRIMNGNKPSTAVHTAASNVLLTSLQCVYDELINQHPDLFGKTSKEPIAEELVTEHK